jgi:hypothetical protein
MVNGIFPGPLKLMRHDQASGLSFSSRKDKLQQCEHRFSTSEQIEKTLRNDLENYAQLLRELAAFIVFENHEGHDAMATNDGSENFHVTYTRHSKKSRVSYTIRDLSTLDETEQLLQDAASVLSDSHPPNDFVVYADGRVESRTPTAIVEGENINESDHDMAAPAAPSVTPIFDGNVANATPLPLGVHGVGGLAAISSGGTGTVLHLACALDSPLVLALLLAAGANARASHTAFRRLMIHEAACCGSVNCLQLLLELGQKYGGEGGIGDVHARLPPRVRRSTRDADARVTPGSRSSGGIPLPFLPRHVGAVSDSASPRTLHHPLYVSTNPAPSTRHFFRSSHGVPPEQHSLQSDTDTVQDNISPKSTPLDFLFFLGLFRKVVREVLSGNLSELNAARFVVEQVTLTEATCASLAESCAFEHGDPQILVSSQNHVDLIASLPRCFLRPYGATADGHGNTPLHWAAFKNEAKCVALLLEYHADPNARAHPSGWTPLHDAAYSNSRDCIAMLIDAGALVDVRANSGATPLCFAAQEDSADAAALLLERGADIAARCSGGPIRDDGTLAPSTSNSHSRFSGYSPLHYCAHYNAKNAARVLLQHPKAKVAMEIPDLNSRLPIHIAVARGSADVLRELLHAGARIETREKPQRSRSCINDHEQMQADARSVSPPMTTHSDSQMNDATVIFRGRRRRMISNGIRIPSDATANYLASIPSTPRALPTLTNGVTVTPGSIGNTRSPPGSRSRSVTPVLSPVLRSMIPSRPVQSSKPWNCLSQQAIDECRTLIAKTEQSWAPDRHLLFTPADRRAVMELLRVGKRLELQGTGIFIDLWPQVLSFCGRGWFEIIDDEATASCHHDEFMMDATENTENADGSTSEDERMFLQELEISQNMDEDDDGLSLPTF